MATKTVSTKLLESSVRERVKAIMAEQIHPLAAGPAKVVFARDMMPMTRDVVEYALGAMTGDKAKAVAAIRKGGIRFEDIQAAKKFRDKLVNMAIEADQDSSMGASVSIDRAVKVVPL